MALARNIEGAGGDGDEGMVVVPRWVLLHTLKKKGILFADLST